LIELIKVEEFTEMTLPDIKAENGVIATSQTEANSIPDIEAKAEKAKEDFIRMSEIMGNQYENWCEGQIKVLLEQGAMPYRVFDRIVGECSRADNIFCGINGEAQHKVLSRYLERAADESQGDTSLVLSWLAKRGNNLVKQRRLVKDFLILDQLTDIENYQEGRVIDEHTPFFNSSLYDIEGRVMPDLVKRSLQERITGLQTTVPSWSVDQQTYQHLGEMVLSFINPLHPESYRIVVQSGSRIPETAKHWINSITQSEWISEALQTISKDVLTSQELGEAQNKFMDHLTAAEAVLEYQYFYVGVGLLRAAVSDKLPPEARKIIAKELSAVENGKKAGAGSHVGT